MGNPLTPLGLPTTVTVSDVTDTELDFQAQGKKQAAGAMEASWIETFWLVFWGAIKTALVPMAEWYATIVDALIGAIAPIVLAVQGEGGAQFDNAVGAIVTDLTGVETSQGTISAARAARGRIGAMQAIGGSVMDLLVNEFMGNKAPAVATAGATATGSGIGGLPKGTLGPEQGLDAARAFLGFGMSFAVRQGNVAVLSRFTPYGILEQFREYGEVMAKNLGLGRLTRVALRPLMQILIADPMTWALNKEYRPARLHPSEAVGAWLTNDMSADDLSEELRVAGYSENRIRALITRNIKHVSPAHAKLLRDFGEITDSDYRLWLHRDGFTDETATLTDHAEDLQDVRNSAHHIVSALLTRYIDGIIDNATFTAALGGLGLTQTHQQGVIGQAGHLTSVPRRTLTLGQAEKAFADGLIDVTELEDRLLRMGYNQEDRTLLVEMALLPKGGSTRSRPKTLSLALALKAFVELVINGFTLDQYLQKLGYIVADRTIIEEMAEAARDAYVAKHPGAERPPEPPNAVFPVPFVPPTP